MTRDDVVELVRIGPEEVRKFLTERSRALLDLEDLEDLVSYCFPGDTISQAAVPRVLAVLRKLA